VALVVGLLAGLLMLPVGQAQAGLLDGSEEPAGAGWTLGGAECDLIEVPTALPFGPTTGCSGVRPGAAVATPKGMCTFNFAFTGANGERYMGTAGHCILGDSATGGDVGERTWAPGDGPVARNGSGERVGEFAYAILQDPKDFALIRLDEGVEANPQMCHFGGPTGINSSMPGLTEPTVLEHYGQGVGTGQTVPARSALALGMPDPDHVYAEGAAAPGDSGSGIMSADGGAVGVVVTTGVHAASLGTSGADAGTMGITRLGPQLARAEQVLGTGLTLETAPPK
jgi:hypothetical protein